MGDGDTPLPNFCRVHDEVFVKFAVFDSTGNWSSVINQRDVVATHTRKDRQRPDHRLLYRNEELLSGYKEV